QPVNAGGSGTACSAVVTFGHLIQKLKTGKLKRVLCVATGSLHSPMTVQQKNTIPVIAHAVSIEAGSDECDIFLVICYRRSYLCHRPNHVRCIEAISCTRINNACYLWCAARGIGMI